MPFQKGHAGFPRRTALVAVEIEEESEPLPIRRFMPADVDDWLIERLNAAWGRRDWRALIQANASSNDVLLITNDSAALCAVRTRHLMAGVPEVHEVFAFSRYARLAQDGSGNWTIPDESALKALVDLYRRAREWKTEMGAVGMVVCKCSDLTVSDLKRYNWKGTRNLLDIQ